MSAHVPLAPGRATRERIAPAVRNTEKGDRRLLRQRAWGTEPTTVPRIVQDVVHSPGQPLDAPDRAFFEPRFGHDFGRVRIHTDTKAAASARAINALAYTVGDHIAFDTAHTSPGSRHGQHILAHELTHVIQQGSAPSASTRDHVGEASSLEAEAHNASQAALGHPGPVPQVARTITPPLLQRYEAGEHAEFGEARGEMKALVDQRALTYVVKAGDSLASVATKFGMSADDVRAANPGKVKSFGPKGAKVESFLIGESIVIPPRINDAVKDALKANELTFVVGGTPMKYGEGITMGDFYEDPKQMLGASDAELQGLQKLIQKERTSPPGAVKTADWHNATGGRYTDLATKNEAHFSASSAAFAPPTGKSTTDNKSTWEKHHGTALTESQAGNKDKALATNSFADHFLTDAFAAGHLTNKRDVMELFKSNLPVNKKGEFLPSAVTFFDTVAAKAFVGAVKTEFSLYETEEWKGVVFRPNIDSTDRFSKLLQGIHQKEPDLLSNAVAKSVHDTLNRKPGGVPVMNSKGDNWNLSGDGTLNTDTKNVARKAVAQSQLNVLDVFKSNAAVDLPAAFKRVWDFVPRPTTVGEATVKTDVTTGTDPKTPGLIDAVADLITKNYPLIIAELVRRKILKKA